MFGVLRRRLDEVFHELVSHKESKIVEGSAGRESLDSGEVKELLYTEATWKGADRHEQETEEEPRGGV